MKIEKRVTRNTRKINSARRQLKMLREEVNSLIEELDETQDQIRIIWQTIQQEVSR